MKRSFALMLSAIGAQAVILAGCPVLAEDADAASVVTETA